MEPAYAGHSLAGSNRQHAHQTYTNTSNTPTHRDEGALTGHDPNFLNGLLPFYDPPSPRRSPSPTYYQNFYEAALRPSPSPPPPNFLDTILNPTGLGHNRYSPFDYRPSRPYGTLSDMPPATRAHPASPRPARLPNGYVDLTATPDSPPQRRKRQSPTPGPSAKRQKCRDGTPATREGSAAAKTDEVDLIDEKQSVNEVLQKQREDAVKSQTKPEEKPTTFNNFNCVICMDMPTDLTATACGASLRYLIHHLQKLTMPRSSLLPHLSHGSPHCRRKSRRPRRS
jgi:hypothetical protein